MKSFIVLLLVIIVMASCSHQACYYKVKEVKRQIKNNTFIPH
jgi:PBP1b-binding outer membrane lipoprotein LpoB